MRVKISDGVWVDVYNLHADAGLVQPSVASIAKKLTITVLRMRITPPALPI